MRQLLVRLSMLSGNPIWWFEGMSLKEFPQWCGEIIEGIKWMGQNIRGGEDN